MTPTLDAALLCSSKAGVIWVVSPDWVEELCHVFLLEMMSITSKDLFQI